MGYYLSKKNLSLVKDHLKELEKKSSVVFKYDKPHRLLYILRQAINTSHSHLKPFYRFKVTQDTVCCIYEPPLDEVQIEISFDEIQDEMDYWSLAQEIVEFTTPKRYINCIISDEEFENLSIYSEKLSRSITKTNNIVELK